MPRRQRGTTGTLAASMLPITSSHSRPHNSRSASASASSSAITGPSSRSRSVVTTTPRRRSSRPTRASSRYLDAHTPPFKPHSPSPSPSRSRSLFSSPPSACAGCGRACSCAYTGHALVGRVVLVFWVGDEKWYDAIVVRYYSSKREYKLVYPSDDCVEIVALSKRRWICTPFHRVERPIGVGAVVRFIYPNDGKRYKAMVYGLNEEGTRLKVAYLNDFATDIIKGSNWDVVCPPPTYVPESEEEDEEEVVVGGGRAGVGVKARKGIKRCREESEDGPFDDDDDDDDDGGREEERSENDDSDGSKSDVSASDNESESEEEHDGDEEEDRHSNETRVDGKRERRSPPPPPRSRRMAQATSAKTQKRRKTTAGKQPYKYVKNGRAAKVPLKRAH